jgi:hypothetical protein
MTSTPTENRAQQRPGPDVDVRGEQIWATRGAARAGASRFGLASTFALTSCLALGSSLALVGCLALGDGGSGGAGTQSGTSGSGTAASGAGGAPASDGDTSTVTSNPVKGSSSTGNPLAQCELADGIHDTVVLVPDASRGVDAALYARAALANGLAPDPSLLRADDFLSFFASPPGYEGAPLAGEVELDPAESLIEIRYWMPKPAQHVARSFVVLLDESVSMQPRFSLERSLVQKLAGHLDPSLGDALVVVGWSTGATKRFDSRAEPMADLATGLDKAFAKPGVASSLDVALDAALSQARELSGERHVLVLSDGGADPAAASDYSLRMASENIRLDAALLALSSELRDPKSSSRAIRYNQELLTKLTSADGTRVLITDAPAAVSDVDAIFGDRFEAYFGVASARPEATLFLPDFLKFVTAASSSSGSLIARSAGFDRALTFSARILDEVPQLPPLCDSTPLAATLDGVDVSGQVVGGPTPLGALRIATRRFVEALRLPGPTTRSAAEDALATAEKASCTQGPASAPLCASAKELTAMLAQLPGQ